MSKPLSCWNCGASLLDIPLPISRHANCPKCYEVLHCCRLCHLYSPGRPGDCEHERADPPVIKESANFCDYFKPDPEAFKPKPQKIVARSQFEALFDTDDELTTPDQSLTDEAQSDNPLDDLFKDD